MLWPAWGWAFDIPAGTSPLSLFSLHGQPLKLPNQYGAIRRLAPAGPRTVFYIEDLHCNDEVQKNIAAIIGYLVRHDHVKLVGQEGAFSTIDTSILKSFPIRSLKEEVSEFLMQQGRLTGAELFSVLNSDPIQLEGIDDPGLFHASQAQIKHIVNNENLGGLADFKAALDSIQARVCSLPLRNLDRLKGQYHQGHLLLPDYCRKLTAKAKGMGLSLGSYAGLEQYGRDPHGVAPEALFRDLTRLEKAMANRLATMPEERIILQAWDWLDLVEKIINISATPLELKAFGRLDQNAASLCHTLVNLAQNHGITLDEADLAPAVTILSQALDHGQAFYRLADRRSTAFAEHLLKKMQANGQTNAILVCGGYHTAAVLEALRRKGISTVLITPALTRHDRLNPYFQLLYGHPTPLEALFQKHQTKMALHSIFEQPAFMGRVQAILKPLGFWVKDHSKHKIEALDRFLSQNQDEYSQPRPWTAQQKLQARCAQWMSIGQAMVAGVSKEVVVMPRNHGSAEFAMPENLFQADIMPHWIIAHVDNEYQVKALVKRLGSKLNEDWGTKIKAILFTPARAFKSGVDSLLAPKQPLIDRIANAIAYNEKVNLCFVCLANRNRSALAELLAQYQINRQGKDNITVTSGGWLKESETEYEISIYQDYNEMKRHGDIPVDEYSLFAFRSKPITGEELKKSDLIVVASQKIKKRLLNRYPDCKDRVVLMTDFHFLLRLRYGNKFPDPADGKFPRKRMVKLLSTYIINRLFQPRAMAKINAKKEEDAEPVMMTKPFDRLVRRFGVNHSILTGDSALWFGVKNVLVKVGLYFLMLLPDISGNHQRFTQPLPEATADQLQQLFFKYGIDHPAFLTSLVDKQVQIQWVADINSTRRNLVMAIIRGGSLIRFNQEAKTFVVTIPAFCLNGKGALTLEGRVLLWAAMSNANKPKQEERLIRRFQSMIYSLGLCAAPAQDLRLLLRQTLHGLRSPSVTLSRENREAIARRLRLLGRRFKAGEGKDTEIRQLIMRILKILENEKIPPRPKVFTPYQSA